MLNYRLQDKVAVIGLDDGKANAVGHDFVDAMSAVSYTHLTLPTKA